MWSFLSAFIVEGEKPPGFQLPPFREDFCGWITEVSFWFDKCYVMWFYMRCIQSPLPHWTGVWVMQSAAGLICILSCVGVTCNQLWLHYTFKCLGEKPPSWNAVIWWCHFCVVTGSAFDWLFVMRLQPMVRFVCQQTCCWKVFFQLRSLEGLCLWGAFGHCIGYKTNEMSHRWIHPHISEYEAAWGLGSVSLAHLDCTVTLYKM